MKRISLLVFCSFYLLSPSMLYAENLKKPPKFTDYPASLYKGSTAQLDMTDAYARLFKTRLSQGLKEKPDYAGEYVVVGWGCGAMCYSLTLISKKTGKILQTFGGETGEKLIDTQPNSLLLITHGSVKVNGKDIYAKKFYLLKNNQLNLIYHTPIAAEHEDENGKFNP
ncbi:hypothetical protein F889_02682 [Acinetobacter colistiniresistens]|uniref:Uncharacterized protein n=1 Tax=Acinetobacter colistiniresistens TaxID=280145 RepID=N9PKP8_9GAMM|nr:hypothetical protein [Acinetobacter colistiniresistens]ENX34018.1 hypothetical protein F889_02682 [Acinetobacter colistiniresistens]